MAVKVKRYAQFSTTLNTINSKMEEQYLKDINLKLAGNTMEKQNKCFHYHYLRKTFYLKIFNIRRNRRFNIMIIIFVCFLLENLLNFTLRKQS